MMWGVLLAMKWGVLLVRRWVDMYLLNRWVVGHARRHHFSRTPPEGGLGAGQEVEQGRQAANLVQVCGTVSE